MKTFNKELKEKLIAEIKKHMEADQIVQGQYGEGDGDDWKGCAVGCSIRSLNLINGTDIEYENHEALAEAIGTTLQIHYLEDKIFEGLPKEKAIQWPLRFTESIPVEVDVSMVSPKFMIWIGEEIKSFVDNKEVHKVWNTVITLYKKVLNNEVVSDIEWNKAAYAAARAAARAADAAADAADAAAYAARAAYAAARAADAAADAAARAAARAAYKNFYEKMSDKLIELLEECKSS